MIKISLSSYTIRIKDTTKDNYVNLDEFLPKKDFLQFVQEYFSFVETKLQVDEENKKLIRINNQKIRTIKRHIKGIIETGEYGFESEIIDKKEGTLKYKRTTEDAELLPFYFLISLPKGKDKGIIILQRFGQYGISKIFRDSLNQFLKSKNKALTLELNPLVPESVVKEFLDKGVVTKMMFRRFEIPKDLADYFDTKNTKNVKGYVEFRVVAARNHKLPLKGTIKEFLTGGKKANKLLEINKVDYNSVKVEVNFKNDKRTVDLGDFGKFRAYYDVSTEVKTGSNGHPVFTSIDNAGTKLLGELNELIYPNQDVD